MDGTRSDRATKNVGFGSRVRAARGYAGGISQAELARRIKARFPDAQASTRTIKRLETEERGVRGSLAQWATWIASVTEMSREFLLVGFEDYDVDMARTRQWESFNHFDWLRIGVRALWLMRKHDVPLDAQRAAIRQIWREGAIPFSKEARGDPRDALYEMRLELLQHEGWVQDRLTALLSTYGISEPDDEDFVPPFSRATRELLGRFVDGNSLIPDELEAVRQVVALNFRHELEIDPAAPGEDHPEADADASRIRAIVDRIAASEGLGEDEIEHLRQTLGEVLPHVEPISAVSRRLELLASKETGSVDEPFDEEVAVAEAERLERLRRDWGESSPATDLHQLEVERRLLKVVVDDHPAIATRLGIVPAESVHPVRDITRVLEEVSAPRAHKPKK